jgi:WD40 repeat protein
MSSLDSLIRKLRKKLRQIENLERLNRPLTEEEAVKLCSKDEVREKLQTALEKYNEGGENADRQIGPSAATKTDSAFSETRGDGDSSDSFSHGHLEESPEQSKQKVPTIDTDKSTQIRERIQHQDQGDTKKQKPSVKKTKSRLSEHICQVSYLEGHSDLITSLVVFGNEAVTASRDTTIKYWDLTQGTEIHHFGSHLGAVTSLIVLDHPEEFAVAEKDKLIISGSLDCTFRLWNLSQACY